MSSYYTFTVTIHTPTLDQAVAVLDTLDYAQPEGFDQPDFWVEWKRDTAAEREQVEAALAAAVAVINRAAARGFRAQRDFTLEQARRDVPMLQQRLRELDRAEGK